MYRRFDATSDSSKNMHMAGQSQSQPIRNTGSFASQSQGNSNRQNGGSQQVNQRIGQREANRVGNTQGANMSRQAAGNPQGGQMQARHHEGSSQSNHNRTDRPQNNINHAERPGDTAQNQNTGNGGFAEGRGNPPQRDGCCREKHNQAKSKPNFLKGLLPSSIYDQKSKKIFGILSAEDLLLVALIFLFLEKDDSDNTIMILALIYVLISDYIDLPDFAL